MNGTLAPERRLRAFRRAELAYREGRPEWGRRWLRLCVVVEWVRS